MLKTLKNYFFLFGFAAKHTHFIWWCIVDGIIWALYHSFTTVVFIKYLFDWIEQGKTFGQIIIAIKTIVMYNREK